MARQIDSHYSWVRQYFTVVKRPKIVSGDSSSYEERDVCKLPKSGNSGPLCETSFKHNLKSGTTSLQRHLYTKHRDNETIAAEIASRVDKSVSNFNLPQQKPN